ncbi:MAG: cobalt-precorrin-5B (C(1))-methyltransferase [Deltaproteobacteria bacterium]|nr:cobalt-precorrin-5B (C(1))-methyltransferase [Deltaproteobacteria bacterium]
MKSERAPNNLRRGFTTGTCAAAGARAAAHALFSSILTGKPECLSSVAVRLPRGGELRIPVKSAGMSGGKARAVIVKDAGDDPDVTNGAEFIIEVELVQMNGHRPHIVIKGGEGVGIVTRPGLKIAPGRPAINPVPLRMIRDSVLEEIKAAGITPSVVVRVIVPEGKKLAEKTMNPRLGILGGISILGTTGIVEPMSLAAYTHSIFCGVDVALAAGSDEVVFSTGRSSEKVVENELKLPEVAYILTGDHMGIALKDASKRAELKTVIVAGQFGKFTKLAAGHFETHCSDSSVEFEFLAGICRDIGADASLVSKVLNANTAREVFFILKYKGLNAVFEEVCKRVGVNSSKIAGSRIRIRAVLVGYNNDIISEHRS